VRVLERVQDEDERGFPALGGAREDVIEAGEPPGLDHECDPLVAVEARERGERAALDLDNRDTQVRRVEDELLEGGTTLGHDQQPDRGTSCDERLLDGSPPGDELLLGAEGIRRWEGRLAIGRRRPERPGPTVRRSAGASVAIPAAIPISVSIIRRPTIPGSSRSSRGATGPSRSAIHRARLPTRWATVVPRTGWPRRPVFDIAAVRTLVRPTVVWPAIR
jgi:hypothetical protein